MNLRIAFSLVIFSAVPAAADQSLLEMLKKPTSPALAAVLDDEELSSVVPDAQVHLETARSRRATREINVLPGSVTTIEITPGREVALPAYVKRD